MKERHGEMGGVGSLSGHLGGTTTYYSDEETEERKQDDHLSTSMLGKPSNEPKADFVKDTFAKFGLSMNLYSAAQGSDNLNNFGSSGQEETNKSKLRAKYFLDSLPDYGFLMDQKLAIP
jgi:hypothetical protein